MHVRIATKNSSKTKFQAKLHNFFFLLWPHSTHFHSHFIIPSIHTSQELAHNQCEQSLRFIKDWEELNHSLVIEVWLIEQENLEEMEAAGGGGGKLKLYADINSPFSRAVILFCRVNGIEHEHIHIDILKRETRTPEFAKINPMQRIPCIDDDGFKLRESVTIMRYLATTRNVPDHWYPQDPKRRAVIDSVLDWIPLNITSNWSQLLQLRVLAKIPEIAKRMQLESDEKLEAKYAKNLKDALDLVETVFLRGPGKFLENGEEVSLADIVLVCQLKQLQFFDPETQKDLLGSREKIDAWMVAVADSTNPHFEEAHESTYAAARQIQAGRDTAE